MPYDGSGNFTIINNFEEDRINGVSIDSEKMDTNFNDIANGLSDCILRSGMSVMIADFNMGNHKIQNLTAGTAATDAVNKNQLDTLSSACVKLTGSQTITGNKSFSGSTTLGATAFNQNVDMNSHKITELANGTATTDAINKGQLDAVSNAAVKLTGNQTIAGTKTFSGTVKITGALDMSSLKITNIANGTATTDAVNKGQLDATVKLTGNQTIAGTKTFSSSPVVPTASNSDDSTKAASTAFVKNILEAIYPVGSVYMSTNSTCPLANLISGSTWTRISSGKALWTGTGSNGGTTIAAGLPNITGGFKSSTFLGIFDRTANGAFRPVAEDNYNNGNEGATWETNTAKEVNFDASKSNSIYGASTTVQPPAYVVNVWRRTA